MQNDLSLRHLPDCSDSSFSFEIPQESNGNFLLNNDDDFLGTTEDSFTTPAPTRTICEAPKLTPQSTSYAASEQRNPRSKASSVLADSRQLNRLSSEDKELTKRVETKEADGSKLRGTGRTLPWDDAASTPRRIEKLRADIQNLSESSNAATSTISDAAGSTGMYALQLNSRAVTSGEDSMSQKPVSTATRAALAKPTPNVPSMDASSTKDTPQREDVNMSVVTADGGGLAERLVMYSRNLVGSHELPNPPGNDDIAPSVLTGSRQEPSSDSPADDGSSSLSLQATNSSLTLSQLSPSKERLPAVDPGAALSFNAPLSPMRQSHKRPSSAASNTRPGKKEKIAALPSSRAALPSARVIAKKKSSTSSNSSSTSIRPKPRLRRTADPSRTTREQSEVSKGAADLGESRSPERYHTMGQSSVSSTSGRRSKLGSQSSGEAAKSSTSQPTRPFAFQSQSDSRMGARQITNSDARDVSETQTKSKLHTAYKVPDFKSSHAAQSALLASIKGQITPVVPLPVEMHTDTRAKERSKFNERVREKEAEMERALAERKSQEAEEAERETRELRKRAIPKAHAVPDWYKDAPKRKKPRSQSGSEGGC